MKLKRFLSMALCVLMLGSLLPVGALAEDTVSYNLWVNSVGVTSANAADVLGNGTVSYDDTSRTLSLKDANITKAFNNGDGHPCAILYQGRDELTVSVSGVNTINTINNGVGDGGTGSVGIYVLGNLKLTGNGYLYVHGTTAIQAATLVTIDGGIHLAAESVSSDPIVSGTSITFPHENDEGEIEYNDWRTNKTSLLFRTDDPAFSGGYFEMLGNGHMSKSYADNGNGTHKVSCGTCGAMLATQASHSNLSTVCDCGIQLAQVGEDVSYRSTVGYWLLHEALKEAANQTSATRVELLYVSNATMPLLQSAALPAGDVLQIGNERTEGSCLTIGDGVTLTLEKNSKVLLYKNTIGLSGSGKVVDMGANFSIFSYGSLQSHNHGSEAKSYVDNGDGTHSATVDCSKCNILYHVPLDAEGKLSAPHSYSSDGKCTVCGSLAAAKVNDTAGDSFFESVDDAVRAWRDTTNSGEKTLTLLQSGAWENLYNSLVLPDASRILDLNGFELTIGTQQVQLEGTELIIRDGSSAGSGVLNASFIDAGAASSLTLESGELASSSSTAITFDQAGSSVTVTGGSIVVSGAGHHAIKAPAVTVSGAAVIEGHIYYGDGTELTFSGYTGDGLDVYFASAYVGGTGVTLPAKYGFHDSTGVQLTGTIAAGTTARVQPVHEHNWSFSAADNVITAVCDGKGICSVSGNTATITLKAPGSLIYDGTKKECTLEQSVDGLFDLSTGELKYSAEPIGVGSYTAGFTYEGAEAVLNFAIAARIAPTLTLGKTEIEYSGSPAQPGVTLTAEFGGQTITLVEGTDYTLNYGTETAVDSMVTVTALPKEGGSYTFDPVSATYKIVQATPVYSIPGGFTATYGQTLADLSLPTAENGEWSWAAADAFVGLVGEWNHLAIFTPTDKTNYKSVSVTVQVTVQPAPITVTGVNIAGKTYDGSDQVDVSSLAVSGRVGQEDVTIEGLSTLNATAPSANAGTYTEVTLPTLRLTGADAGNYTLTQPGKLAASYTIGQKIVAAPTVEVAAGSYVYNGKAHTPAVTVKDGSAVIPASEYTVRYDFNINAGTGRAYISDNSGGNYAFNPVEGSFPIQQAVITITADNKTATTGQQAPTPTYSTSGVVVGETFVVLPIVEYVTKPDMSKAGTTVIRASGAVAPSSNYTIKYVDGTLTVSKASSTGGSSGGYYGNVAVTVDMSGVKLESKTYDGKPLAYSGKASARYYTGDFTYTWYTSNGYRLNEAPTDAGDYVLRATVSRSGYSGYASKNVSIRKAQLTITADDISAEVGDELPKLSYKVKGLAAGDKLRTEPALSYETEPDMEKPGKTPILVSGAAAPDNKNYESTIKYIEGTLTVSEKKAEESVNETRPTATPEPVLKLEVSVAEENKTLDKELDSKQSAFYDLALQRSEDGGENWSAAPEQLPEGGVKVSLPLPDGSDETCSFRVLHEGGEYPVTVTKHEDGKYYLDFTATGLGTVSVGWTAPGKEGGFPWWILLAGLGVTGAAGGAWAVSRKRRRY